MKISRREFLQLLGVTGAVAGGVSGVWAIPDSWSAKLRSGPRIETWKLSTCGQCPAGCGIRVRMIDDLPVRILGNPIAPVNGGFTCPMGESGLELLYHPDRIGQPMRRKGKKGEGGWEPVSWEDALAEISRGLRDAGSATAPGRAGFVMGDGNTLLTEFAAEFCARLGRLSFFPWGTPAVNGLGLLRAAGAFPPFAFDLTRTDCLVTFGANLLEAPPSPVHFNRLYGKLKEDRARTGTRMVHVDARMAQPGINATEWVRIRPGTQGVLALGMAHVILRDGMVDREFASRRARDFAGTDGSYREMVTRDYSPERVSEITGVPAQTVIRLAREFGSAKAPLALAGGGSFAGDAALSTEWAVASLNAVAGSFSAPGLWREPVPLPWKPAPVSAFGPGLSAFSRKSAGTLPPGLPAAWVAERLPDLRVEGRIPEFRALLIAMVDPIHRAANRDAWKEWLSQIPLVVQFATLLDDTSRYADLVLPLPTYLEHWDLTLPVPNLPFAQLGLMQPVVPPLEGSRPLGDVLLRLGKEAGANPFPELGTAGYEGYVRARAREIFASGKGTPFFETVSLEFLEDLRRRGWQVYSYPAFGDFFRLLREKGGWWDPGEYPEVDWERRGRFAFPTAARAADLPKEGVPGPAGPDSFLLFPFPTLMNMTGGGASQPLLQELFGLYPRLYWQTWAEMHPDRAQRLGLRDGDRIRVVAGTRSLALPVRIVPTVSPEILAVPFGQGHEESGRYAKGVGANPAALLERRVDPSSGRSSWLSTVVRVEKIPG